MKTAPATRTTSDRLTTVLSYGALLLLGYVSFLIIEPFLVPLAWSALFAIFFFPLHKAMLRRMKPTPAALVSTLLVTILLIVPALTVLWHTAGEALDAAGRLQAALLKPDSALPAHVVEWTRSHLPQSLQNADLSAPLRDAAQKIAAFLAGKLGALLKNLFSFFVDLFILLFSLFFMFRDSERVVRGVRHLFPFEPAIQDAVIDESRDLVFASVAVGLIIAAIQGALGGFAFAVTGIPTPLFWGVVIAFFSLVPIVGSALIWVPAALWMAFAGHWGKGIVILVICGGVAGVADNIIRPLLLRNRTRLNELLLFVSVLGGLQVFGLLGLVIGPAIIAAALAVYRVYMERRDQVEDSAA